MVNKFILGLEIELIYNRTKVKTFDIGEYHNGVTFGKYWKVERDGSLRLNGKFSIENSSEFVSRCLKSKKAYFSALKEFKDFFSSNGLYELKEVLDFNNSTGSHIHIGLKDKNISKFVHIDELSKIRRLFFKLVKNSNILQEKTKESILKHYFRHYAQKNNDINHLDTNNRYKEFNLRSELEGKGFEWRSLNLNGVEYWSEFEEMFKIFFICAQNIIKSRVEGYNTRKKTNNLMKIIDKQNIPMDKNDNLDIIKPSDDVIINSRELYRDLDLIKNEDFNINKDIVFNREVNI